MKIFQKWLNKKETWLIILLLLIALFFRIYKLTEFYGFDHDEDLYSWIVKDILVSHHLRLIGQLTSIEGVFIGPLFYYALIPFYALFNLNPLSANNLTNLVSLATLISIYFVFSKFFNKFTGIFGSLIYACSLAFVDFDRWVVPTQPTILWTVWYLYCLFSLAEGRFKIVLPLTALLIGLIWHIHLALLPLIFPLIISFLLSRRKSVSKSTLILSSVIFLLVTSPFFLFELKNNFLQIKSLFFHRSGVGEIPTGFNRLLKIFAAIQKVFENIFFQEWNLPGWITLVLIFVTTFLAVVKKYFNLKQIILILTWVGSVTLVQLITQNQISEYYVANFMILPVLIIAIILGQLAKEQKITMIIISLVLIGYGLVNLVILINRPEPWHRFKYKLQTVDYIKADALKNSYPCIAINYIHTTAPNTGFRYLLWWRNLNLVTTESGAPIYNIVIPYDLSKNELDAQFHYFGVILPKNFRKVSSDICYDPKYQPLPPLGFTN